MSWMWRRMRRSSAPRRAKRSRPRKVTVPASGSMSRRRIRPVVDLPEPDSPDEAVRLALLDGDVHVRHRLHGPPLASAPGREASCAVHEHRAGVRPCPQSSGRGRLTKARPALAPACCRRPTIDRVTGSRPGTSGGTGHADRLHGVPLPSAGDARGSQRRARPGGHQHRGCLRLRLRRDGRLPPARLGCRASAPRAPRRRLRHPRRATRGPPPHRASARGRRRAAGPHRGVRHQRRPALPHR